MIRGGPIGAAVALALAVAGSAQAQSGAKKHDSNAPADVTADRLEVQDRANRAIATGNVHIVQGDMTLDAARVVVAYRPTTNGDREIQRMDASGGVKVVDPTETATGSYGIYDLDKRIITLIGNVVLIRGDNKVNGARLVMDLNSGRSTVDGTAVGTPGTSGGGGGRVTGHFTVPKRDAATPAPAASAPKPAAPPPR